MVLTNDALVDIIGKRPNSNMLMFGTEQRSRARMHMYGYKMGEKLTMIEHFEKPWMHQIRNKWVQSNKDLFTRVAKPITKVFTARGGASYYNLTDKENSRASQLDEKVWNGMSIKKWMETFWKFHLLDDPMGLVYMEIDQNLNCYPTYKSIDDIHEYQLNGDKLDYVIFNLSQKEIANMKLDRDKGKYYRVVDDTFDKIVLFDGNKVEEVPGQTFINYFGFVPGITNSPFINPDGDGFISPFHWVFDLADQYLLKISVRLIHELQHGFPKYWEFGDTCTKCKGTGKFNSATCPDCKGSGVRLMLTPKDNKIVKWPTDKLPFALKGNPGGYIEPSKTFAEIVTNGLLELEERITQTMWGSKTSTKLKPGLGLSAAPNGIVTATEVLDNRQPEIECLNVISDAAESRDKFITDCVVTYKLKKYNYMNSGGSSKNYGRRFLIEEPDALLQRYTEAKEKKLSATILFNLYEQYLEAKYQSDPVSLNLHKKLMRVEPFMHNTLEDLTTAGMPIDVIKKKIYWSEWLTAMGNSFLIMGGIQDLVDSFNTFISGKPNPIIPKEKQAA